MTDPIKAKSEEIEAGMCTPSSPVSYETWMATVRECNEAREEVRRLREAMAAQPTADGGVKPLPVAWRWRPKHAANWIYNPEPEWLRNNIDTIEAEPLYNKPPKQKSFKPLYIKRFRTLIMVGDDIKDEVKALLDGPAVSPQQSGAGFSAGGLDNLLSRLDQGAAYQGYPEGFGFSLTQLAGDAATVIRRLRTALAPKGAAPEREVFRCNCPHEVRAGCSETKCPHYAVPRAVRGGE